MIRKEILADAAYSVVDVEGVRRIFATVTPGHGVALSEQAESALQTVQAIFLKEGASGSIVMLSVFLKNINDQTACRQIVEEFFGNKLPATSYIPQPPCDGKLLSVEAWGLIGDGDNLQIEHCGRGMVIAHHNHATWAYLADVRPETAEGSTFDRSLSAFHAVDERLNSIGWQFNEVIRTWLYLGNITGKEGQTNRYLELNRARTDFYRNLKFGSGLVPREWGKAVFPASTGIGAGGNNVAIDCIAFRADRPDATLLPLENPRQISAYDYAHAYGTETPKFVRAMAVATGDLVTTFISGTASITASESRHDNSVEQQTLLSLENIEALIASDNFRRHRLRNSNNAWNGMYSSRSARGIFSQGSPHAEREEYVLSEFQNSLGATLDDLAIARVYIKRQEDYNAVRAICRARLGDVPTIYVVGDICRTELLVEIEGLAFCSLV